MAEEFLHLSDNDRRDALGVAASISGRPPHLLEKDVWVVWALNTLFSSPFGDRLVFKGGTSLSKAYRVIQRFSEDVDLTYDIRALIPDLVGNSEDPLPSTRSEEKRWTSEVRRRLPVWVADHALPVIEVRLNTDKLPARARVEGDRIFVTYEPLTSGSGYVRPVVMLEFGARSTGEPSREHDVVSDAAEYLPNLSFPVARPRVMNAERTFWEKATAVHVFCAQGRLRGDRFARHWHDLTRLDMAGFADLALADRDLATAVARHKSMFFSEKDGQRQNIDYEAAVSGGLILVPNEPTLGILAEDYGHMVDDGLLLGDAEPFDVLMERCGDIARRVNRK